MRVYCIRHCNWYLGSQTLFLLEHLFLTGPSSMSRFVQRFSFSFKKHHNDNILQKENNWNATESNAAGGEHHLPYVPFPLLVTVSLPAFDIDTPEYGPGAIFGAEGVSTSTASTPSASTSSASTPSASTSSTSASSAALPKTSQSKVHAGPIAGGVVGGVFFIGAVAIFYLRWRKQRRSQSVVGALIRDIDETNRPGRAITSTEPLMTMTMSDDRTEVVGSSTLNSIVSPQPSSSSGVQIMKLYVRDFMPYAATNMCPHAST